MSKRIYLVSGQRSGSGFVLVRARNRADAIRHVASSQFEASVATQEELVAMISAGARVQESGNEEAPEEELSSEEIKELFAFPLKEEE
jgi:hypothetical protein